VSARRTLGAFSSAQGGASAAEFALCLPLLAALLMGVFEFGWTQHCLSSVRYGLEKAGRHLTVHPDATEEQLAEIVETQLGDLASGLDSVSLAREARGPTGQTGVLTAVYQRTVGIPGLVAIPISYEAVTETPISQFSAY